MMMDIDFVPLQEEDLEQVIKIEQCSFPTPWSKQAFISEIYDNSLSYYCVGKLDGQVITYGGMWIIIDEAHVTNIAVHPDYRGRKIGENLLLHLIVQGIMRGALRMTLEVRPSNLSAQKLYQRMGFEAAGLRRGYYTDTKEDAIIMWKTLVEKFTED
ncbi:ribosomal protein S18-alanine N-acetyltransferase [Dehalobacterium formicoaceticum]|uniref:ribosomal protein S18-alanine N-acetyltransferase n=1 Tax=Dehalobacterium formicoaceticum TaxID=51515 RepID=UPI0030846D94